MLLAELDKCEFIRVCEAEASVLAGDLCNLIFVTSKVNRMRKKRAFNRMGLYRKLEHK
jgi:hypothetical protein